MSDKQVSLWKVKLELAGSPGVVYVLGRTIEEAIAYGQKEMVKLLRETYGEGPGLEETPRVVGVKLDTEGVGLGPCVVIETEPPQESKS